MKVQYSDDECGYPATIEYQATESFKTCQPALCTMIQPCGGGITDLFLPPVFGTEYGLRTHNGVHISFNPCVFGGSDVVDKQIIVAPLQVEVGRKTFLLIKQLFTIGKVTSYTHIRITGKGKTEVTHGSEQIIERYPFV